MASQALEPVQYRRHLLFNAAKISHHQIVVAGNANDQGNSHCICKEIIFHWIGQ